MPDLAVALAGPFPMDPVSVLGFTIQPFGALTVLAIVVGVTVTHFRARALGLSTAMIGHASLIAAYLDVTPRELMIWAMVNVFPVPRARPRPN